MIEYENYVAATSVAEATKTLAEGNATVVAGGTDLMVQTAASGRGANTTLLNIRRISDLRGVALDGGRVTIGALTTITDLLTDGVVADAASILADTANRFASNQIRNMATVGGNICNASPAGDMIIPLLVLDADVELSAWRDGAVTTRAVALNEFFTGPGKCVKTEDELLTSISFNRPAEGFVGQFGKTGPRPALEISMVSVGVGGIVDNGGLTNARVVYGAVAPTPIRAAKTEAALEGLSLNEASIQSVLDVADSEVNPISDVRASDWYRRHLVRVMTQEVLQNVANG
ncbi:MAG: xanthine dehydrogenase family protein subunit M [Alphaproteobacteria bacterium]|nr:xanthine dehydrogenase family protein subunit M [Alphaproteobacteria bacterium]MBT4965896.1 xanthine dehydrogenase family protein subunit M [Alphaproteobacteria bacterium]MBT5158765.1 xanthine dehydrogenase family protein subunit M [Alphaproteobacteria bacterium]MBT5918353.1 xanthine dehydrogenase family protein subunit M [Alphaproteobacteria bacterium]MBT6384329.1 xanthine dehydrogenase family protein subunit M [Alphaproteobacteria bacterium]